MKTNIFKYFFIIFAIIILILAIVKIRKDEKKSQNEAISTNENVEEIVKELRLGIASFDSINPILSKNKNVQDISKIIYEPLFTLSPDYKLQNCLAKEWAKQTSTTYLIKLNDGIRWSDGKKFCSEDVRFTIDRLKDSNTIYSVNVQNVIAVETVDDTTIRITLNKEIPFFEYNLTFPILPKHYYEDKEFSPDIVPIGTGMYAVVEVQDKSLILNKNNYYNNEGKNLTLEKIIINLYPSVSELYNAFKMGNIDFINTQNSNIKDYIGTIGYQQKEIKGREHDFIALNTQSPILSQLNVRKAIAYSIDRSNIVSSIYTDKYYISSFPLDYGNWIYENKDTSLGYNVEQAKLLLVDNGWHYKNKYWQKTLNNRTQKIALNFVVKASDVTRVAVAENIKSQLENQGIRINLIKASDSQYSKYLENKNYDMILCSINLSISPDLSTFFGENNLANYTNSEVSDIMNEVNNITDDNKLRENYKKLGEIYKNEVPYLSLYNNKYTAAYARDLAGDVQANWFYQFYNIEEWHR